MSRSSQKILDFSLVYNNYKHGLYNYAYKMLNNKFVAEDITQNVFLKFYENLELIRNREAVSSWLFKTARNEVYAFLRKEKVRNEGSIYGSEIPLDENLINSIEKLEFNTLIKNELNKMDKELKEVFFLREYSELSYKEISEILNIEISQVKGRLFRARKKLIENVSKLI